MLLSPLEKLEGLSLAKTNTPCNALQDLYLTVALQLPYRMVHKALQGM